VIDLDRDLPTTREDVTALRRVRNLGTLDLERYLDFLSQLPPPGVPAPVQKPKPRGGRPFVLTD
jgi:hypothetical protein